MDHIIEALIQIEERADGELRRMEAVRQAWPARIRSEIQRRTDEINERTDGEIRRQVESITDNRTRRINEIEADAFQKASAFDVLAEKNRNRWRRELFDGILAGVGVRLADSP